MKGYNKMTEPVMTPEEQQQRYIKEYTDLCRKHGLQIVFVPQWKLSADTGTYSMIIQTLLGEFNDTVAPPKS